MQGQLKQSPWQAATSHRQLYIMKLKATQSHPTLCHSMDFSPPGYTVHGIFQARILEWVAIPFSRGSSQPRDRPQVSCIAGKFFTLWATRKSPSVCDSCSVMSNSLQPHGLCSLPASSVHGILQTRILEWIAIPFSRVSSWPRNRTRVSLIASRPSLPSEWSGKPLTFWKKSTNLFLVSKSCSCCEGWMRKYTSNS